MAVCYRMPLGEENWGIGMEVVWIIMCGTIHVEFDNMSMNLLSYRSCRVNFTHHFMDPSRLVCLSLDGS